MESGINLFKYGKTLEIKKPMLLKKDDFVYFNNIYIELKYNYKKKLEMLADDLFNLKLEGKLKNEYVYDMDGTFVFISIKDSNDFSISFNNILFKESAYYNFNHKQKALLKKLLKYHSNISKQIKDLPEDVLYNINTRAELDVVKQKIISLHTLLNHSKSTPDVLQYLYIRKNNDVIKWLTNLGKELDKLI